MNRPTLGRAPDYTTAALICAGVNLFCLFFAIWTAWGMAPVLLLAVVLNHLIDRFAARKNGPR